MVFFVAIVALPHSPQALPAWAAGTPTKGYSGNVNSNNNHNFKNSNKDGDEWTDKAPLDSASCLKLVSVKNRADNIKKSLRSLFSIPRAQWGCNSCTNRMHLWKTGIFPCVYLWSCTAISTKTNSLSSWGSSRHSPGETNCSEFAATVLVFIHQEECPQPMSVMWLLF